MMLVSGPFEKIAYSGLGDFKLNTKVFQKKSNVFMLGGGTGITPLISITQASVRSNDGLIINLLYSNKTRGDILYSDYL